MVFTLLGNKSVNLDDGWVTYNPISLESGRTYLMEILITSSNPDELFSSWQVRYAYPTRNTSLASSIKANKIYYEPINQYFEFSISQLAASTGNAIFAVRRFAFYSQPNILADAKVALALDPDLFF